MKRELKYLAKQEIEFKGQNFNKNISETNINIDIKKEKKTLQLNTKITPSERKKLDLIMKETGMKYSELISYWIDNSFN